MRSFWVSFVLHTCMANIMAGMEITLAFLYDILAENCELFSPFWL